MFLNSYNHIWLNIVVQTFLESWQFLQRHSCCRWKLCNDEICIIHPTNSATVISAQCHVSLCLSKEDATVLLFEDWIYVNKCPLITLLFDKGYCSRCNIMYPSRGTCNWKYLMLDLLSAVQHCNCAKFYQVFPVYWMNVIKIYSQLKKKRMLYCCCV